MASSNSTSTNKAQIPSICHLCEDNPNVQWKCVDCDLLMCSKCKTKVHSKFKAADDHDVISFKDVSIQGETSTKPSKINIACEDHIDQKVCLYCKTCGKMACPVCITNDHKKHELEDLHKVLADRTSLLEYFYDEMEADLNLLVSRENEMKEEKSKQDTLNETTRREILSQKEHLVKLVDLEASKLLQQLDIIKATQEDSFSSAKADNSRIQGKIKSNLSTLEDVLRGKCMATIIQADKKLFPSMVYKEIPNCNASSQDLILHPGKMRGEAEMLGSIQMTTKKTEKVKLDVLISHESDMQLISNLFTCKNGNIVMCDQRYTRLLRRSNIQDNRFITLKDIAKVRVSDVTETYKNEILVSFVDKKTIESIGPDGTFETFLDLSPLLPRALHNTRSGRLLVSVRESGNPYPPKETSQRKLLVIETNGKIIHEYNRDTNNKRMFTNVARVTSGTSSHIYLLDWTSLDAEGSVVAIGFPDNIIWRYSGSDTIQTNFSFRPTSIVATELGNIVVSDMSSNLLHILNCDGLLKTFVNTTEYGIIFPMSLTLENNGLLYIGCSTPKEKPTNAMVYAIKFSGF